MDGKDTEFLVENLLAATSPEYLESIEEARRDCKYRKYKIDVLMNGYV
ncbi:hypothetical protein M1N85_03565 [Dehalococcoidia bacterium]|nr:hypothetical protein [Dehalococcoidia bacterium]